MPFLAAVVLAAAAAATPTPGASPTAASRRPHLLRDASLAAAASAAVAMIKPDIRRAILHDGRFRNIGRNFADPIMAVRDGTRRDTDPVWVNYVAHPVSFAAEGLYLKHMGYSDGGAFLFTQVHSVLWEFAVEGCAFPPSGKDLLTDATGAALAIWVIHPRLSRHARVEPMPQSRGARLVVAF